MRYLILQEYGTVRLFQGPHSTPAAKSLRRPLPGDTKAGARTIRQGISSMFKFYHVGPAWKSKVLIAGSITAVQTHF